MPSTFLHLSDIHFRKNTDTLYDASKNLRDELEADAERNSKELGGIHAILVSGDIAFSGHEDEYKIAHGWLQRLCAKVGCPLENVWVIPGNHDVDRKASPSANLTLMKVGVSPNKAPLPR
jgi:3',5'-cyclic AMP phosphodiesterase CpdA